MGKVSNGRLCSKHSVSMQSNCFEQSLPMLTFPVPQLPVQAFVHTVSCTALLQCGGLCVLECKRFKVTVSSCHSSQAPQSGSKMPPVRQQNASSALQQHRQQQLVCACSPWKQLACTAVLGSSWHPWKQLACAAILESSRAVSSRRSIISA